MADETPQLTPSTDDRLIQLFQTMTTQQMEAQARNTDRLVDAMGTGLSGLRSDMTDLKTGTAQALTETRSTVNRNSIAVVVVALVAFVTIAALASGQALDLNLSPDGLSVGTAEAAQP